MTTSTALFPLPSHVSVTVSAGFPAGYWFVKWLEMGEGWAVFKFAAMGRSHRLYSNAEEGDAHTWAFLICVEEESVFRSREGMVVRCVQEEIESWRGLWYL